MRVVHFSRSPLAGAPIRLVDALRRHTGLDVRLVDSDRWSIFAHDVVFSEDPEEALALADQADVIHLHNYLDYGSDAFHPIDFEALRHQGKRFVRQFHSTPALVAREMGVDVSRVLSCPIPSLVIAQFQERYYPAARVVPNLIPQDAPDYLPDATGRGTGIVFCPTNRVGAWDERWNTKGYPEMKALLERVRTRTGCPIVCVEGCSHPQSMIAKRQAAVSVDELVTGSYHLSGLEALSVARPSLAFLDGRTERVLREVSGASECPFVNVQLEDACETIVHLLAHPDEAVEVGHAGRNWIERYWSEQQLIPMYLEAYEMLMDDPRRLTRQEALRIDSVGAAFFAIQVPDLVWRARAEQFKAPACRVRGPYAAGRPRERWQPWLSLRRVASSVLRRMRRALRVLFIGARLS